MTRFRRSAAFFILCCGFVGIHHPNNTRAQADDVIGDPESYVVFAAALAIRENRSPLVRVALLEETRAVTTCPNEKVVPPEWRSVLSNHRKENARIRRLRTGEDLGRPYSLVSMAELRSLMRSAGYDLSKLKGEQAPGFPVFRRFSGGRLIAFSAVGFDEQKTRAIVTMQYDCFPTAENQPPYRYCHHYQQLVFEKREGKWIAVSGVTTCSGAA